MAEPTKPSELAKPKTQDEVSAFLKRVQSGDTDTIPVLKLWLQDPKHIRVFGGELAELVERSFIDAIAEKNLGWAEAITRKLELLRAEILGTSSTPVERLLVERIVACWLQVQDAEIRFAQTQKQLTMQQGDYYQRRMDAANRRFLAALKTLALVRKMALPALQVNIAKNQVNVAGGAVADPVAG